MKKTFACPHCRGVLNPNVKILLVADTGKGKGLVLLSPQPGNYKYLCDSSLGEILRPGTVIAFSCPLCHADLTSARDKKLAAMEMHIPGQSHRRVEFSRVYGTHASFVVREDEVEAYGEDAEGFDTMNFFGS